MTAEDGRHSLDNPEFRKEHAVETYKSLIQISMESLKLLTLLNGGAVVALLAYLGNVVGKNNVPVPNMRWPMGCYLFGLIFCGVAYFSSYLTQLRLYQESVHGEIRHRHEPWLNWALYVALLSLLAFALGSFLAVIRFR